MGVAPQAAFLPVLTWEGAEPRAALRPTPRGFPHAQRSACQATIKTHRQGDLEQLQKLY